ncbi:MAG: hypothetical protein H7836_14880 [Magnetococcus sp. YQC-3]
MIFSGGRCVTRPPVFFWRLALLLLPLSLLSCLSLLHSPTERMLATARSHALRPTYLTQNGFSLLALTRQPAVANRLLVVYLEGDGLAWLDRHHLSADPTPRDSLVLGWMLQEPAPAAVYLGRPCQFLDDAVAECPFRYWSSHRYAPEVVTAMSGAIDTLKRTVQAERVGLVGYSGGGTIGALLAAQRSDVAWLVTVAANLDLAAWTSHHQVSPLPHSGNPADFADRLSVVPQFHFVGELDKQVPPAIVRAYAERLPASTVTVRQIPGFDHVCCWVDKWPELRKMVPFLKGL